MFTDDKGNHYVSSGSIELFAKKIIDQCVLTCLAIESANSMHRKFEFALGAAKCAEIIKRDFGVE